MHCSFLLAACGTTVESSDSVEKSIVIANDDLQEVADTKETIEIEKSSEIVPSKDVKEDEIDEVQSEETSHMEVHYIDGVEKGFRKSNVQEKSLK